MHRLGQRHHCGSGLSYGPHHSTGSTALLSNHYNSHRYKNECCCLIF